MMNYMVILTKAIYITLSYTKYITKKDILYNTGNYDIFNIL